MIHYADDQITLHHGDALDIARTLDAGAVDCIVTSPPYFGLRDYGTPGQYGLEASPAEYVETMRALFAELRRILADDGTLWLNLGDSYAGSASGYREGAARADGVLRDDGHSRRNRNGTPFCGVPPKNLLGIPWRVAFALQDDGWILRNAIIWQKPNAMPESVTDRLSGRYEHVFMFSKKRSYWFDLDPIREDYSDRMNDRAHYAERDDVNGRDWSTKAGRNDGGRARGILGFSHDGLNPKGRNPGDVWNIPTQPFSAAHFAVMPVQLAQRCIVAGCKPGGTVLDPFNGSGTTGLAAQRVGRKYIGIDLNREYLDLTMRTRLAQSSLDFGEPA